MEQKTFNDIVSHSCISYFYNNDGKELLIFISVLSVSDSTVYHILEHYLVFSLRDKFPNVIINGAAYHIEPISNIKLSEIL